MSITIEILSRMLPFKDTRTARVIRNDVWTRCDTNQNGFVSLKEIEEELLRIFSIQSC